MTMIVDYKHQDKAIVRFRDKPYGALLFEPGMGKTRTAIRIIEAKPNVKTVWVFTPKTVISTWVKTELPRHSTEPYIVLPWKHGGMTDKYRAQAQEAVLSEKRLYIIVNYEACLTAMFEKIWNYIKSKRQGETAVILDESTYIKSPTSRRTTKLIKLAPQIDFRMILTGTPITNSPLDMFSQAEFLSPGARLIGASSWYGARNRYAILQKMTLGMRSFDKVTGYKGQQELAEHMAKFSEVAKLTDAIDMPERIFKIVDIELTEEQEGHLSSLKKYASTTIENEELNYINAVSLITAFNQLVNGQLRLPSGEYASVPTNKMEALLEQLEELEGRKVIVWVPYVETGRAVARALEARGCHIVSGDSPLAREEKIAFWKAPDGPQALVLNPQLGGHGLTLNEATAMVYFGRSHSVEHRLQSLARNYRIGQLSHTLVVDLVTPDTIDEDILKALEEKKELGASIMSKAQLRSLLRL